MLFLLCNQPGESILTRSTGERTQFVTGGSQLASHNLNKEPMETETIRAVDTDLTKILYSNAEF
jgi:hypothetical protein